ncbi:MAG TPA: SelB C-terminal domain-containing protein, partial [Rhodopila sp.]
MAAIAADAADADGLLTAAAFRDRLNNGRKVAILILEFFDKAGVTIRFGDVRRVRLDRIGLFGSADCRRDRLAAESAAARGRED